VATQILEGTLIENEDQTDPDLNQAFWEFADQIKAEANASGSIAVFEVPVDANGTPRPNTYKRTKLFTVPVGTFTLDDICDRVLKEFVEPGGRIMIQLMARKDGAPGIKLNRMIPLRRGRATETPQETGTAAEIAKLMRVMNEERARDREQMREILLSTQRPQVDTLDQGLKIAERITALSAAANAGRIPGAQAPAGDPSSIMNNLMGLMLTKMFEKMFRDQERPAAPASSDNNILGGLVELAKPLLEAHAAEKKESAARASMALTHQRQAPEAPQAAAPSQDPPKDTPPPTKETGEMKLHAVLTEGVPQILAVGPIPKNDPALVAKLVMDEFPEEDTELNAALYQLIQSPGPEFLQKLALFDKRVLDFPEWFEAFAVALNAEFDPDKIPVKEDAKTN